MGQGVGDKRAATKVLPYWQDLYSVLMVVFCFALLLAPFVVELSMPVAALWLATSCMVNFIVNLIDHNHIHVGTFGYKSLNTVFGIVLTVARGASERFTVVIHTMNHHRYEGTKDDWFWPGNEGTGPLMLRPFVYAFRTGRRFKSEGADLFARMAKVNGKVQAVEKLSLVAFIVCIVWMDLGTALVFVVVPWIFGNYFIVFTNLLFHKGCDPSSKLTLTRNYVNRFEGLLFLNGGYHTMHHLKPNLHWSKLPREHAVHVGPFIAETYVRGSMVVDTFHEYFNPFRSAPAVTSVGKASAR